ncbi:MAG: glycosyltransferase family 2 protein [Magnetococcales bacterium]|nr:glycosyltransferase family 2 protein [Magnetococcales bacterium]
MKLVVQIPCFNEEKTLPQTIADIPRKIAGIDQVEILVVDDGSSDATSRVAEELGVEHIIRHPGNRGLAASFQTAIDAALRLGADIIVNTDGDNQYCGADIPKLIQPILEAKAEVVVGDREVMKVSHFGPGKKLLSRIGSFVVSTVSGVEIPDAVSGFRAFTRQAALELNIVSSFSYTIEMLLQCGRKNLLVTSVPVGVNGKLRSSRLFRSIPQFIFYSVSTLLRIYSMIRPLRFFLFLGGIFSLIGLSAIIRFLFFYLTGDGGGHIQSLVIGGSVLMIGVMTFLIGLLADLIAFNRQLIEGVLLRSKNIDMEMEKLHKKVDQLVVAQKDISSESK